MRRDRLYLLDLEFEGDVAVLIVKLLVLGDDLAQNQMTDFSRRDPVSRCDQTIGHVRHCGQFRSHLHRLRVLGQQTAADLPANRFGVHLGVFARPQGQVQQAFEVGFAPQHLRDQGDQVLPAHAGQSRVERGDEFANLGRMDPGEQKCDQMFADPAPVVGAGAASRKDPVRSQLGGHPVWRVAGPFATGVQIVAYLSRVEQSAGFEIIQAPLETLAAGQREDVCFGEGECIHRHQNIHATIANVKLPEHFQEICRI